MQNEEEMDTSPWYKEEKGDKIWWKETPGIIGEFIFSFDRIHEYNFFRDYEKLTPEQKEIFKKENPGLARLKRD